MGGGRLTTHEPRPVDVTLSPITHCEQHRTLNRFQPSSSLPLLLLPLVLLQLPLLTMVMKVVAMVMTDQANLAQ
jgi:hypothetical protein